jgi:hypothetical protein
MDSLASSRQSLQRVAVHIVARSRVEAAGRFSLRITPGGFGTPDIGSDGRRVRVSGGNLVVESDAVGAAAVRTTAIHGASLADLAAFAGVDLSESLDVGHDTPPVGDTAAPIELPVDGAREIAAWFAKSAAILDGVLAALPATAAPTLARLWPEHFDVAVEAQSHPTRRVNLGGSPGDGFSDEPYLYVGPWTADRPGDAEFWNAGFGAFRTRTQLAADGNDIVEAGIAFLLDGVRRLA